MSKEQQIDKLIKNLGIKVAAGILTRKEADAILYNFGKKIGYYQCANKEQQEDYYTFYEEDGKI